MNKKTAKLFKGIHCGLWSDVKNDWGDYPNLAHYTTLQTLENIIDSNELWLSSPLLMNDLDEVKGGLEESCNQLDKHDGMKEALSDKYDQFLQAYRDIQTSFYTKDILDTYIFCFSEHCPIAYPHGRLSMWRGYGQNGSGCSIVFDLSNLTAHQESPLILSKVEYVSMEERNNWIVKKLDDVAALLFNQRLSIVDLRVLAGQLFNRFLLGSLFSKHMGFSEENEWRIVYLPSRDPEDRLESMRSYVINQDSAETKLKWKLEAAEGVTAADFDFPSLVKQIILGPEASSFINQEAVKRMLRKNGMESMAEKVFTSGIPYRAKNN